MKKKQEERLDLDEENDEKAKYAGMLRADITATAEFLSDAVAKKAKINGDISARLENFEKKGGNKRMMKWALALANMTDSEKAASWRQLKAYSSALGVFDQMDLFEQESKNQANAASIAAASAAAPKFAQEPSVQ